MPHDSYGSLKRLRDHHDVAGLGWTDHYSNCTWPSYRLLRNLPDEGNASLSLLQLLDADAVSHGLDFSDRW